ncbi:MAG TPA: hypothetical protein VIS04_05395 [Woeseiaceae bacterium]
MLGRFLELSIPAADVAASLSFYRALGFSELSVSDAWKSAYAVVSDGKLCLGLHDQSFEKPTLTFVYPGLRKHVRTLTDLGFKFTFQKLGDDEFNEVGFVDIDGNVVSLQEARTFSPPADDIGPSLLGDWLELSLPVRELAAAARFWAPLAPSILAYRESPELHLRFAAAGMPIGLTESTMIDTPSLCFVCADRASLAESIETLGIAIDPDPGFEGSFARLQAPEGTQIYLFEADFARR